jgi:hypothetical protein
VFGPLFIPLVAIPSATRYWYRRRLRKAYGEPILKKLPSYDSVWFEGQATRLGYTKFEITEDLKQFK